MWWGWRRASCCSCGAYDSYAEALHDTALATITGETLGATGTIARLVEVMLAVYSVAVFATLAGALSAFFLTDHDLRDTSPP